MSAIAVSETLDSLAAEIQRECELCEAAYRESLLHARKCGELLIEARERVRQEIGPVWLKWLADHGIKERLAQVYMRLARHWKQLEGVAEGLTINEALQLLAPEPPVVEAELVIDSAPPRPPLAKLSEGDRALVAVGGHIHHGEEVRIIERTGAVLVGELIATGEVFPFLPAELAPVAADAPAPAQRARKLSATQAISLLERCYQQAAAYLDSELRSEVESALGLA